MKTTIIFLALSCVTLYAADKPNVILIYTDDQGYGDASCLNPDSKFQTPALDRLAKEGMTFTDAHTSDSVCTPSRYSILTGRYSWRTRLKRGVFGAETPCLIEDGRETIASLLKRSGYATAMIGKWHLGMDFPGDRRHRDWSKPVKDMPLDKGFEYFYGIPASLNYGVLAWFEGRHAEVPPTLYTKKKPNDVAISDYRIMPPYKTGINNPDLPDDEGNIKGMLEIAPDFVDHECLTRFTDKTIEWITNRDEEKPFFVYLPYTSPHKPVIPIDQFLGKSEAGAYGDFMMETDWHIGRILDHLDEFGLAENTIIIFSSDNGPEVTWPERKKKFEHASNGIYREGKRSIYEGGHRVPFFVRWPARVQAGSSWDEPISQMDVIATLADLLEQELPSDAAEDSESFLPALTGAPHITERHPIVHHDIKGRFAIRDGEWKLVMESKSPKDQRELYQLSVDPSETANVIKQHPGIEARLVEALTEIVRSGATIPGKQSENDTLWWDNLVWMEEW
ncbi:MAG: arylsulfatase [Verrucomicrobiales bacterium]|nr:arylsulfatase [Verrucomicrobiales bacterium]